MSDTNEITNGCLTHYDNRHIQTRIDFMGLCPFDKASFKEKPKEKPNRECMAKIMRLMETLTDHAKVQWKLQAAKAKEKGLHVPQEPKEYPLELSNGAIISLIYNTFEESMVRNCLDYLVEIGYLKRKQTKKNAIPVYWLQLEYVQVLLQQQAEAVLSGCEFVPPHMQGVISNPSPVISNHKAVNSHPDTPFSHPSGSDFTPNNISKINEKQEKQKEEDTIAASPNVEAAALAFEKSHIIFEHYAGSETLYYHSACVDGHYGASEGMVLTAVRIEQAPQDALCGMCQSKIALAPFEDEKPLVPSDFLPEEIDEDDRPTQKAPVVKLNGATTHDTSLTADLQPRDAQRLDHLPGRAAATGDVAIASTLDGAVSPPSAAVQQSYTTPKSRVAQGTPTVPEGHEQHDGAATAVDGGPRASDEQTPSQRLARAEASDSTTALSPGSSAKPAANGNVTQEKRKRKKPVEVQLTLQAAQLKEWYEELRGVKASFSKRNVTALESLSKKEGTDCKENFLNVVALLDIDPWFEKNGIGVDPYWIDRQWENKFIFLQRKKPAPKQDIYTQASLDRERTQRNADRLRQRIAATQQRVAD